MKIHGVLLPANNVGEGGHISITDLMVPAAGVPVLINFDQEKVVGSAALSINDAGDLMFEADIVDDQEHVARAWPKATPALLREGGTLRVLEVSLVQETPQGNRQKPWSVPGEEAEGIDPALVRVIDQTQNQVPGVKVHTAADGAVEVYLPFSVQDLGETVPDFVEREVLRNLLEYAAHVDRELHHEKGSGEYREADAIASARKRLS